VLPALSNDAHELGIDFTFFSDAVPERYFLPEVMGGGSGWLDFDLDGDYDVYFTNGCELRGTSQGELIESEQKEHVDRLFMNLDGKGFIDVTAAARFVDHGYGQGCAVGDFDADGFPDIFVANYGTNALYRNNGDGTFEEVTQSALTGAPKWSSSCAWFDANHDGLLDLYVVTYMEVTFLNRKVCNYGNLKGYCGPGDYEAVPDRLYINQGDGTFLDKLDEFGMTAEKGSGLGIVIADFDNDLRPEVYVANDMSPNFLFALSDNPNARTASRDRPYFDIATMAGCAVSDMGYNEASMGVSCADFDGDGLPDLYLTHFYNMKNTLYHNLGKLAFVDDSKRSRVILHSKKNTGFGTIPFDYDGDGNIDLFLANGHVLGPTQIPWELTPQIIRNAGEAKFDDISEYAGEYFAEKTLGRGAAAADFDNDGDVDISVTHLLRPVALLRNNTKVDADWVGLDLKSANRIPPVGGRIVVIEGERRRVLPITTGGSYLCSHDPRYRFWTRSENLRVEIHWPSGRVSLLENPMRNRYLRVEE